MDKFVYLIFKLIIGKFKDFEFFFFSIFFVQFLQLSVVFVGEVLFRGYIDNENYLIFVNNKILNINVWYQVVELGYCSIFGISIFIL